MKSIAQFCINLLETPEAKKALSEGQKFSVNLNLTTNEITATIGTNHTKDFLMPEIKEIKEIKEIPEIPEIPDPVDIPDNQDLIKIEIISFGFRATSTENGLQIEPIDADKFMKEIQDKFKNVPWMD